MLAKPWQPAFATRRPLGLTVHSRGAPEDWRPTFLALDHFLERLDTLVDEVLRAAAEVELADGAEVEAQVVVESGPDFLETDWAIDRVFAQAVGRADDLTGP